MIPSKPQFLGVVHGPVQVIAYHGCHQETARQIIKGNAFVPSANPYDWLGEGVYFWEHAPFRAWEWAWTRFGNDAAVLKADITLGHCLNLLDTAYFQSIQLVYQAVADQFDQEGRKLPTNRADKRHFLDRTIIDEFCKRWVQSGGIAYQTVRGCFPEGDPIYPGSRILRLTHVQIAVRDATCLSGVELVE